MPTEEAENGRIKTAIRVFDIIETIRTIGGATLTELSAELGIPKSTLHAYLSTLDELGYVDRQGDEYDLGLKYLDLGMYARGQLDILSASDQVLKELAEQSREVVWLATEYRGKVVYVATERDNQSVQTYAHVGQHEFMHSSAAGKAILAHYPEDRTEEIVEEHGLPANTEHTITDVETLLAELDAVRERGYATSEQETAEGISAISAPVIVDGSVLGSVTVAGPATRLTEKQRREEIVRLVQGASDEVALNLKYS